MCEEEMAQTGHELARRHKGTGGARTRLLASATSKGIISHH